MHLGGVELWRGIVFEDTPDRSALARRLLKTFSVNIYLWYNIQ